MEQKNQTKKLPVFYIALCCCVITIGIAGFIAQNMESHTTTSLTQTTEITPAETQPVEATIEATTSTLPAVETIVVEPSAVEAEIYHETEADAQSVSFTEDYTYDNPDVAQVSVNTTAQESTLFNAPVKNTDILEGFSNNNLIYNEIYKDWRCHNGVDYTAAVGDEVFSAADGRVVSITNGSYGKQISIEHNDGFVTIYAQLSEIKVSEGEQIKQGETIGTVAQSIGENTTSPHLHFEIKKNDKYENPEEY